MIVKSSLLFFDGKKMNVCLFVCLQDILKVSILNPSLSQTYIHFAFIKLIIKNVFQPTESTKKLTYLPLSLLILSVKRKNHTS